METTTNKNEIIRVIAKSFGFEVSHITDGLTDCTGGFYLKSDFEVEKGLDGNYYYKRQELMLSKQVILKDNSTGLNSLDLATHVTNFASMVRESFENEIEKMPL